jgi:hypothetical protein
MGPEAIKAGRSTTYIQLKLWNTSTLLSATVRTTP